MGWPGVRSEPGYRNGFLTHKTGDHMRTLKPGRRRSTLAAGLATLAIVLGAVPAQALEKTKYIALGDSFAAGQGAGPYLDNCYRSENTYAELAADAKGIKLIRNAACSGKTTQEVVDTQLGQLNRSTELVTITAGGNNLRVGDLFRYCSAAPFDPRAVPGCVAATAFARDQITSGNLVRDVASLVRSVRAAAPNARIVLTGYPDLYDPAGLDPADPLAPLILNAAFLVAGLNASIATAAQGPGVEYVDVRTAFAGHGIGSEAPWINYDPLNPLAPEGFHPTAAGYKAYYAALKGAGVYN